MAPPPIAVVGIGGIFPQAPNLERFWENIRNGRSASRKVPEDRWVVPSSSVFDPEVGREDKVYSKHGCFIENFNLDPDGLNIDPKLLEGLDPLFHLVLHAGRQAFEE